MAMSGPVEDVIHSLGTKDQPVYHVKAMTQSLAGIVGATGILDAASRALWRRSPWCSRR